MSDNGQPRFTRVIAYGVAGLFVAGTLAACSTGTHDAETGQAAVEASMSKEDMTPVVSVDDGATQVNPSKPVTVKITDGELKSVTMTNEDGKVVESELSKDKKNWTTKEDLGYSRTYTLVAVADNGNESKSEFSTIDAGVTSDVSLSPLPESTVGVGQTVGIRFDNPVKDRHAAQDSVTITTEPKVEGQFYWLNNSEVRWRPKDFWEPGTKVKVKANIYGVDLGGGTYGGQNNETSFTVGDKVVAIADDETKTMTIKRGNEELRTMPISMGSGRFPTPNGTYIVGDRNPSMIMDSSTYGTPIGSADGYRTHVDFATQMSYSGIYVHAAPWSLWAQGSQDVSHGCINVSTDDAAWFQDTVKRGDIVMVKNTIGEELSGLDGLGDWNIPWEKWSKGNADETSDW